MSIASLGLLHRFLIEPFDSPWLSRRHRLHAPKLAFERVPPLVPGHASHHLYKHERPCSIKVDMTLHQNATAVSVVFARNLDFATASPCHGVPCARPSPSGCEEWAPYGSHLEAISLVRPSMASFLLMPILTSVSRSLRSPTLESLAFCPFWTVDEVA